MGDERIAKYFALCAIKIGDENHILSKAQLHSLFSEHEIEVYFDVDLPDLVVKNGGGSRDHTLSSSADVNIIITRGVIVL